MEAHSLRYWGFGVKAGEGVGNLGQAWVSTLRDDWVTLARLGGLMRRSWRVEGGSAKGMHSYTLHAPSPLLMIVSPVKRMLLDLQQTGGTGTTTASLHIRIQDMTLEV